MDFETKQTKEKKMTTTLSDGYNIVPPTATTTQEPPDAPVAQSERKPRTMTLFFCGLQWSVIAGIVMFFSDRNGCGVFQCAAIVLMLALSIAALGLVWGVFQHVLKTIVRIVRHGN